SLARDAADLIEVEYESLPAVSDPERALGPGAPLVHPEFGTNQAFSFPMKGGDVNAAFARAAHVARVRVEHNRLAGAPMEPRGVDLRTTRHGRATVTEAEAAVTSEGEIIGLRAKAIFDLGAHLLSLSIVPTMSNSIHVLGPYRIQNAELLSVGVYTNTGPTG